MDGCNVCGGTDMNLVDGYYYCVECGTQDVNVRETIVEQTVIGDGTFAHTTSKKITTVVQDGIEMSSEWYKWHIFNFILVGLTNELIALGAKPSVKMKVLWIWSRYVKQFQVKDDLQSKHRLGIEDDDNETLEGEANNENDKEDSYDADLDHELRSCKSTKSKSAKIIRDLQTITKGTILTILYVALNLDRSDIQLSHLFRFIREGRLSLYECMKYVPKELKMNAVANWKSFTLSLIEYNPISIRELSLTCFKILKLGVPLVPDLRKLVGNFIQELCLPSDVKDLVYALMHFMPTDFLHVDAKIQKSLVRIPDYEGICMAYILVALKMCFGLDDDYDLRISKEIDKINDEENYLKSYKLGVLSEPCDRLFSFNEWCQHLRFRKYILCMNYLPMSRQFNDQTDDLIFMEHLEKRRKKQVKLSDDVTMDILKKLKSDPEYKIIPKTDFPVTLTPMSTYVDVIAQHVQDPELQLLLCEDFTQYSLKYAMKDFILPGYLHDEDNAIVGVCESGKVLNKHVIGTLTVQEGDMTMVYIRNCQNKNWLKTQPPKMHHVTKIGQNENNSDEESDHRYDSNIENSDSENDASHSISDESPCKHDKVLEIIDDVQVNKCIFDDNFMDTPVMPYNNHHITVKEEQVDNFFENDTYSNLSMQNSKINSLDNIENIQEQNIGNYLERDISAKQFDPNIFDRDKMINDLIKLACEKYKISIPKENTVKKQSKRKVNLADNEAVSCEPKKKRTINRSKPGEAKQAVDKFISAYYNSVHNDILNEVSLQVKSIIENVDNPSYLENVIISNSQNGSNESNIMNSRNDISDEEVPRLGREENEKSHTEISTNDNVTENNQVLIDSSEQNRDSVRPDENVGDKLFYELFPESAPKFDEKEYDIRQLYIKVGEDLNIDDISISDIIKDPKIDNILQKQIERYSSINERALDNNKINVVTDEINVVSDSDDDVPLSILKEYSCFEQEKKERKKEKIVPLIKDSCSVNTFKYWVRHYKSVYVVKSRDIGKKFDLELHENLPVSFVFVIRECAAILGCSMFSLYKNMQNIEEILIANLH